MALYGGAADQSGTSQNITEGYRVVAAAQVGSGTGNNGVLDYVKASWHSVVRLAEFAPSVEQRPNMPLPIKTPSGGATPIAASDTGAGTDATLALAAAMDVTDTGVSTQSRGAWTAIIDAAAPDTGVGTDASALTIPLSATDTGVGTDTATQLLQGADLAASDTGVGSEVVTVRGIAIADVGAGADASSSGAVVAGTLDTGTGTDLVTVLARAVADVGAGVEALGDRALAGTDTGLGDDASNVLTGNQKNASDTATVADAVTLLALVSANDAGSATDATQALAVARAAADTGTSAEATPGPSYAPAGMADVGVGTETALVTIGGAMITGMTAVTAALRALLAGSLGGSIDDSGSEPFTFVPDRLYLWEERDDWRSIGDGKHRRDFMFAVAYGVENQGEEARQHAARTVTDAADSKLTTILDTIRQNQHALEWANVTTKAEPDALRSYGLRGFLVHVSGYRIE